MWIGDDMFVTPETAVVEGLGPGDDLYITGLFSEHYGKQRNLPIVRSGTLAAMPAEPVADYQTGLEYPAYIIEARSTGGLSGSPVFVRFAVGRVHEKKINLQNDRFFFLGLVRGHWNYKSKGPALAFSEDEAQNVNMGMALVVPSDEVRRLLFSDALTAKRRDFDLQLAKQHAPTDD